MPARGDGDKPLARGARAPHSAPVPKGDGRMRGLFLDAADDLAAVFRRVARPDDPEVDVREQAEAPAEQLPSLLAGYDFVLDDHSHLPTAAMARCPGLKHVVFLGTGARSYMNPEELAALGITVHIIRGYGDTAVAEHAMALMFSAARGIARMDRDMRAGTWTRMEGPQLTGKTLGLIGFGGIGAELGRLARGIGMRVLAWNRTPRQADGVDFVALPALLAESDVISLHLLLNDGTRGFLQAEHLAAMKPGAMLVNTARGALVDEAALLAALRAGRLRHAALDVFETEPLPAGHPLAALPNVTLSAHSGFRTPEASERLLRMAMDIARGLTHALG